jgi:hypothetical protein
MVSNKNIATSAPVMMVEVDEYTHKSYDSFCTKKETSDNKLVTVTVPLTQIATLSIDNKLNQYDTTHDVAYRQKMRDLDYLRISKKEMELPILSVMDNYTYQTNVSSNPPGVRLFFFRHVHWITKVPMDYIFRLVGYEPSVPGESYYISDQTMIYKWVIEGTVPNGVKENLERMSERVSGQHLLLSDAISTLREMILEKLKVEKAIK